MATFCSLNKLTNRHPRHPTLKCREVHLELEALWHGNDRLRNTQLTSDFASSGCSLASPPAPSALTRKTISINESSNGPSKQKAGRGYGFSFRMTDYYTQSGLSRNERCGESKPSARRIPSLDSPVTADGRQLGRMAVKSNLFPPFHHLNVPLLLRHRVSGGVASLGYQST